MEKYELLSKLFDEITLFIDEENNKEFEKINKFMNEYNKIISDVKNKSYDKFMNLLKSMKISVLEGENRIKIMNNNFIIKIDDINDEKLHYLLLEFYKNEKNKLLYLLKCSLNNTFFYIK